VAVEQSKFAMVTPVIAFVTPAAAQLTLFFVTLVFFLATQINFRRYVASFFNTRDAKLRFIRISNDIEEHLASLLDPDRSPFRRPKHFVIHPESARGLGWSRGRRRLLR